MREREVRERVREERVRESERERERKKWDLMGSNALVYVSRGPHCRLQYCLRLH